MVDLALGKKQLFLMSCLSIIVFVFVNRRRRLVAGKGVGGCGLRSESGKAQQEWRSRVHEPLPAAPCSLPTSTTRSLNASDETSQVSVSKTSQASQVGHKCKRTAAPTATLSIPIHHHHHHQTSFFKRFATRVGAVLGHHSEGC